jgi:hypothetical protein
MRLRWDYRGAGTRQGGVGEDSLGPMIIAIRYRCGKSLPEVVQPQIGPLDVLDCLLAATSWLISS